ncbi:Rpn family recombination-promoting nuclease/putative transposase [Clostridium gasigenes]|uniref:Rpn family recombination-promoting nuclease/putative transposase n=1 Tax=Clostridium gasigenes TaxID=94869 RepID=UPI001C0B3B46|nr:Rpn family recombination-promoting nuclease/putative transposase [Clostridium gasigenes]MBU3138149.1 Rpn family recombination-promoting nuclease/putative transposase [Clostridium gasigenes]
MSKTHDFDGAWKAILEAFEVEIVELLFPEIFNEIDWKLGTESLDMELKEIQKEIFDKYSGDKVISDKIIKVRLKDNGSKILFIHIEVQSYDSKQDIFGERMFRYFYRIWDKFRYKYEDKSEIVAAAIYTYKGRAGKDERYVYKLPEIEEEILRYNFRTIDVETIKLENISDNNPLKLVFKMAKSLLETNSKDEDIYIAKVKLAEELAYYDKVKDNEQIKALVDFLEYLFLIQDPKLEKKYEEYKREKGGALKMTIEEIRKVHYKREGKEEGREEGRQEGKEQGREEEKIKIAKKLLDVLDNETIALKTGLTVEFIESLR